MQSSPAPGRPSTPPEYPIGTIAFYGPDETITTKVAAGVITSDDAEPVIERWMGTGVSRDPRVLEQIDAFFKAHDVKSIAATEGNIGCPHEEGDDFPDGGDCPFCPYWKGKQGSGRLE